MQPVKNVMFLTGFFILAALLVGCESNEPTAIVFSGQTMGTSYHIKVIDEEPVPAEALQQEVDQLLVEVNEQFSTYIASSEVSKFNTYKGDDWYSLTAGFISLTEQALQISRLTAGAYDITVGPLVNLWGFGPGFSESDVPKNEDIQRALSHIGYQNLAIDVANNGLKKSNPDLYIDFSSIAKGHGVDRVAQLIEAKGYHNYMVEIGGEMRVSGVNAEHTKWRIAVEKPDSTTRAIQRVIKLSNTAIATSGDYRNFFVKDGQRFSHTLDPVSGRPVQHTLASVTVLAPSSAIADAWATAFMVLGSKKGYDLAMENKLAVLFLIKEGASVKEVMTPYFQQIIEERSS